MTKHSKTTFSLALGALWLPATLAAQATGSASAHTSAQSSTQTSTSASASASASAAAAVRVPEAPRTFTASGKAKLDAMYASAHEAQVPTQPMERRVAEGQAKGASEAAILASVGRVQTNLQASQSALVTTGRSRPARAEVEAAASAMERGATALQIEAMARRTPSDRSLVVAFDVLSQLTASGVPVTQAVAQVQGKLDARASDAGISSLISLGGRAQGGVQGAAGATGGLTGLSTGASGSVAGGVAGSTAGQGAGGAAGGAAGAAVGAGAVGGGVAGTVGATVGGVIGKKP